MAREWPVTGSPVKKVTVVGAGWAGLAAAVRLVQQGHRVTLLEMAPQPGGRARQIAESDSRDGGFDNGQQRRCRWHVRGPFLSRDYRRFNCHVLPFLAGGLLRAALNVS